MEQRTRNKEGQSLVELLISIAVGALFIAAAAAVIAPSLRENKQAANVQEAATLGEALLNNVRVWSERDWHGILSLATGSINTYYLNASGSPFTIVTAASGTFSNGYAYRRTITIQGPNATNLQDFPVLVSSTISDLAASSSNGAVQSATGNDIGFYADPSGTVPLYAEQESYSSSTGAIIYWVQVPTLQGGTSTPIYMFYDNATPPASPGYLSANVWDSNYVGVYHFSSANFTVNATPNSATNLNPNPNLSMGNGTVNGATSVMGEIDGSANFVSSTKQSVTSTLDLSGTNQATIEFWLKQPVFDKSNDMAVSFTPGTAGGFWIDPNLNNNSLPGGFDLFAEGVGSGYEARYTSSTPNVWHQYIVTLDESGPTIAMNLYVDGVLKTPSSTSPSANSASSLAANSTLYLMAFNNSQYFNTGVMDEVRISSDVRSADWIKTEYSNENSPGTFYAIGGATTPSGASNLEESITLGNTTYSRYFYVNDVYRSSTGTIVGSPAQGTFDPSTKEVTVVYGWPGSNQYSISAYLTRHGDNVFYQDDWSGGPGAAGPSTSTSNRFWAAGNMNYASAGSIAIATTSGGTTTSTLDSITFDTGAATGAQLNSITWSGTLAGGSGIGFQFATSSSATGPWNFTGPGGDPNQYYAYNQLSSSTFPLPFSFSGIRYFRYRVTLWVGYLLASPVVNGVSLNWSP
ncbi:MAG: prepilin-type N-terminal cleavage/methylation domain-containing protein [Patescibacteria group bacterium]|nr:prepilin-type N-terminal cleavage/methylation domain-containing protein [Patescibacteria group bacterium]